MSAKARLHRAICSRWLAGDEVGFLAEDYGISRMDVVAILRAGLTHKRVRTKR